jgi:PadR family transcriptional regulator PadR
MSQNTFYKGSLETILLRLLEENGRMYGYEITKKVKEVTGGGLEITEGALYPSLHKLESKGWLTTETLRVDGRRRKYYSITPQGGKAAKQKMNELAEYLEHMQLLLNPNKGPLWS